MRDTTPLLFSTFDAGMHELPVELVRRRNAVRRIEAALTRLGSPPVPGDIERQNAEAIAQQACDQDDLHLNLDAVDAAEQLVHQHARSARVLTLARTQAAEALADAVHTEGDTAIREYLAPTLAAIVADGRKAAATYLEHGSTAGALITAPAAVRTAWSKVDDLAARFVAIRSTRTQFIRATGIPQRDDAGDFSLIRNPEQVWPEMMQGNHHQLPRPWRHDTTRALLEWLTAHPNAEVWLPTAAQQDARWQEVWGPRIAEARANRHGAQSMLSAMGGSR
jgi:hypothetical protein